jgi:hypothetical protein
MKRSWLIGAALVLSLTAVGCKDDDDDDDDVTTDGSTPTADSGTKSDASTDAGGIDASTNDAGRDSGSIDATVVPTDSAVKDASTTPDASNVADAATLDAG